VIWKQANSSQMNIIIVSWSRILKLISAHEKVCEKIRFPVFRECRVLRGRSTGWWTWLPIRYTSNKKDSVELWLIHAALCPDWLMTIMTIVRAWWCNINCWWRHATLFDLFVFIVQYEDMSRRIHCLHCLACWRGLDASWSRIEVGLLVVCWDLLWIFKVKVSREIAQFSPCRTRTYATRNSGSNGPVSECPPA
jgi:hypothetical protein